MALKFTPLSQTVFYPYSDKDDYIVNQDNLSVQELSAASVIIVRVGKDYQKTVDAVKTTFNLGLPQPLRKTQTKDIKCFWVSPDEYWFLVAHEQVDKIMQQLAKMSEDVSCIDSSGAYGLLCLSGSNKLKLLQRVLNYDIELNLPFDKVVSTVMTLAPVLLYKNTFGKTDDALDSEICLLIRNSFANYVANLLKDVAQRI